MPKHPTSFAVTISFVQPTEDGFVWEPLSGPKVRQTLSAYDTTHLQALVTALVVEHKYACFVTVALPKGVRKPIGFDAYTNYVAVVGFLNLPVHPFYAKVDA